jgi:hypothetical protein
VVQKLANEGTNEVALNFSEAATKKLLNKRLKSELA